MQSVSSVTAAIAIAGIYISICVRISPTERLRVMYCRYVYLSPPSNCAVRRPGGSGFDKQQAKIPVPLRRTPNVGRGFRAGVYTRCVCGVQLPHQTNRITPTEK